ncbi:MAG TPA: hypothetical protein VGI16_09390 [Candidatus Acidoferrum sp.]|jgi:hypothetical protein
MIKFLANIFRAAHMIIGMTAPKPGHNERAFVFTWLAVIALFLVFAATLSWLIPYFYFH